MNRIVTLVVGSLLAGALAGTAGCDVDPMKGYSTRSQYVQGVKTVFVPIWQRGRNVYRRELEKRLTEAVIKRMELDTPYKQTDKSRADTELTGTLERISQRVLSYNPDSGLPREKEIVILVSYKWTDLRNGKVLAQGRVTESGVYIPPAPLDEDFFQGSEDVINKLAKRVVEKMEASW